MNPQTIQLIIAGVATISNIISNSKPNNTYNNCNITTNNNYYNNDHRSFNEATLNGCTSIASSIREF